MLTIITTTMIFLKMRFDLILMRKKQFEIVYFLMYFLYWIFYQVWRAVRRRIKGRLPFLMYTNELKLLTYMYLYCHQKRQGTSIHNLKKLFIRQRFRTLSSLYRRSSSVYVFRQEWKWRHIRIGKLLGCFFSYYVKNTIEASFYSGKKKNCSNTRHRVCN